MAPAATTSPGSPPPVTTTATPAPPPAGIARRLSASCTARLGKAETASVRRVATARRLQRQISTGGRTLKRERARVAQVRARLDAAYQRALANRTNANVNAYNSMLPSANAQFRAFNGKVHDFNATIRKANATAVASNRAERSYERTRDACLRKIPDWTAATAALNTALVAPSTASGTETPTIVCDPPAAKPRRERFHELGHVDLGSGVMHLAAVTCFGLERVSADPSKLACVTRANRSYVSCPLGLADAALAIVTLAHEQEHVDGTRNEAETECHAYQKAPMVAEALGVTPNAAAAVGRFAANAVVVPRQYRSRRCKSGGAYDLHLPDAPAKWSYTGVRTG
jgi:hypothetical protein